MLNIMLCGCGGRMGAALNAAATANGDRIVAGVDINPQLPAPILFIPVRMSLAERLT